MGKGIPDIVAGQPNCNEGSCATDGGGDASSLLEARRRTHQSSTADTPSEHDRAHDAMSKEGGGKKAEDGVDTRIHLLDRARRRMADAGAKAAAGCSEARAATEPDAARRAGAEG